MDYKPRHIKSYLTYYNVAEFNKSDRILAIGEDIVRKFRFCILTEHDGSIDYTRYFPSTYISIPNTDYMQNWRIKSRDKITNDTDYIKVHGGVAYFGSYLRLDQLFGGLNLWAGWWYNLPKDRDLMYSTESLLSDLFDVYERLIINKVI